MITSEILVVLYKMRSDWTNSIKYSNNNIISKKKAISILNTDDGFCYWLHKSLIVPQIDYVFIQLQGDIIPNSRMKNSCYWYYITYALQSVRSINECLQIRLDHLNRTITRLEKNLYP